MGCCCGLLGADGWMLGTSCGVMGIQPSDPLTGLNPGLTTGLLMAAADGGTNRGLLGGGTRELTGVLAVAALLRGPGKSAGLIVIGTPILAERNER